MTKRKARFHVLGILRALRWTYERQPQYMWLPVDDREVEADVSRLIRQMEDAAINLDNHSESMQDKDTNEGPQDLHDRR